MSLAIFDLDNTLIAGDSDYLWGQFLVDEGIVDAAEYEAANAKFYEDYKLGTLDIAAFLAFSLKPLAEHEPERLYRWRDRFVAERIAPLLLEPARQLISQHQAKGDTLLVITATNRFVSEPIVQGYGIAHLLATEPELLGGRYTGRFVGIPCFQEGKVKQLQAWLAKTGENLAGSWFYSDSHNDLPLLQQVANPVAVDPDAKLAAFAEVQGWPVISLRGTDCPLQIS